MKRHTATIERYHCYGTRHHHLRVTYRGKTLQWSEGLTSAWADMVDYGQESIDAAKGHARKQGFTHCRFVGDWTNYRSPQRGGKL